LNSFAFQAVSNLSPAFRVIRILLLGNVGIGIRAGVAAASAVDGTGFPSRLYRWRERQITAHAGVERVDVRSRFDTIGRDISYTTVRVVDGGMRNRISRNAGARKFEDATASVGNRDDVEDGVAIDKAVSKEPRRRALDVDAIKYDDVTD
jgi:hypothetical protein